MAKAHNTKEQRKQRAKLLNETKPGLAFKENPDYERIVRAIKIAREKEARS